MSRIVYYLILKPLSLLPLPVLYLVSDVAFILLFHVAGYRRKVVQKNMTQSFPEWSPGQVRSVMQGFYRHFCDLVVESIRLFSISKAELNRRCLITNPELVDDFFRQGRSIIIVAGHYNNWEMGAMAYELQGLHQSVGIYAPLRNRFFDAKLQQSRARYGMGLVSKKAVAEFFEQNQHQLTATMFGADQSPHDPNKAYWMRFLNQDTAVMFGTEKYARQYNYPVVYGAIRKVRRGYYEFTFELVEANPASAPYGRITEGHTRLLEEQIRAFPQYWLWTHRRWKREKPAGVEVAG